MSARQIGNGCDLRKALQAAVKTGCSVQWSKGSGDLLVRHPSRQKPIQVSGHRKEDRKSVV